MTDIAAEQARIDAIRWYHEFDFPSGTKARDDGPDRAFHRDIWRFISNGLNEVDFAGKSVLEIGCWDGYWSFDAERRGARAVLATDDRTQNWSGSAGLLLAKELLGSKVETDLEVSIYDLGTLGRTFDVILCLGVYYHLIDPFYAFAQVRHRCHDETIVVFEGDVNDDLRPYTAQMDLRDHTIGIFIPATTALEQLLGAAYFRVVSQRLLRAPRLGGWANRVRSLARRIGGRSSPLPPNMNRALTICTPFRGTNAHHFYAPPFGLRAYDDRFTPGA